MKATVDTKYRRGKQDCLIAVSVVFLLATSHAHSQSTLLDDKPNNTAIELPDFDVAPIKPGSILPGIKQSQQATGYLYSGQQFLLTKIIFSGNTVFSDGYLANLSKEYINKNIAIETLQRIRDRITLEYVNAGYISSGATFPDQTVNGGTVTIQIVEGRLAKINVTTDGDFKQEYFKQRIAITAGDVLNVKALEQRLFRFQQDPRIKKLSAELKPADMPGESSLSVEIEENPAVQIFAEANNYHTPSVGAEGVYLSWRHGNWQGSGEVLFIGLDKTEGLTAVDAIYEQPLSAHDDSLSYFTKINRSEVIDGTFESLNIESRSYTLGAIYKKPIKHSVNMSYNWFVTGELRRSESLLLGDGFSFSPGPENGESKLSLIRAGVNYQSRSPSQVLAARVTLTQGLDLFDVTTNNDDAPDAEFSSLLLQAQWAKRLAFWQSTFISRFDLQLSSEPLLGLEQYSIGGHDTVRGYRENSLVRDQGSVISVEWRVPYLQNDISSKHELAIFADAAYSKNKDRVTDGTKNISSAGVGFVGYFSRQISYQLYWADALKELEIVGDSDLQDDGIHFNLRYTWE